MKTCQLCLVEKDLGEFPIRNDRSGRLRPYCKGCSNDIQKARYTYYRLNSPFKHRCTRAKTRAKQLGVDFNLTPEYLESIWTGLCAATGIPIRLSTSREDDLAAELDRIVPEKGYTRGNVAWLSRKMNRVKNNVGVEELKKLWEWLDSVTN